MQTHPKPTTEFNNAQGMVLFKIIDNGERRTNHPIKNPNAKGYIVNLGCFILTTPSQRFWSLT